MTGPIKLGSFGITALFLVHLTSTGLHHLQTHRNAATIGFEHAQQAEIVVVDSTVRSDILLSLLKSNPARQFQVFRSPARDGLMPLPDQITVEIEKAQQALAQDGVKYVIVAEAGSEAGYDNTLLATVQWDHRFKLVETYGMPSETNKMRKLFLYENVARSSASQRYVSAVVADR